MNSLCDILRQIQDNNQTVILGFDAAGCISGDLPEFVQDNKANHPCCVYAPFPDMIQTWNANLGHVKLQVNMFGGKSCQDTSMDCLATSTSAPG